MDSREARQILASYRPGDTDSPDPRMAQALKLAREDPQLAVWFGQHCAAQIILPAESQDPFVSPVPRDEPAGKPAAADTEHIIPLTQPVFLMVGAAFLILAVAFAWAHRNHKPQDTFESYRDRMARLVQRSYPVKIAATDQAQVREYFRTNGGAVNFPLPKNLEKLPAAGAAVFTWNSRPVSLLDLDAGGNTNLYLFLIKQTVFAYQPSPGATPEFHRVGRLITASWTVGDTIYLLTGPLDEAGLKNYLQ